MLDNETQLSRRFLWHTLLNLMMALRIMGVFRWRYRQTDSGHCRRLTLASNVNALGGFLCICLPSVAQAEVQEYDRASTWECSHMHHHLYVDSHHCPLVRFWIWSRDVQIYIYSYLMHSQSPVTFVYIALNTLQIFSMQLTIINKKITVGMLQNSAIMEQIKF